MVKIPRINITSSNSNTHDKSIENEKCSKEENEDYEGPKYHGKVKGEGKNSNRKTKPLIEDDY